MPYYETHITHTIEPTTAVIMFISEFRKFSELLEILLNRKYHPRSQGILCADFNRKSVHTNFKKSFLILTFTVAQSSAVAQTAVSEADGRRDNLGCQSVAEVALAGVAESVSQSVRVAGLQVLAVLRGGGGGGFGGGVGGLLFSGGGVSKGQQGR